MERLKKELKRNTVITLVCAIALLIDAVGLMSSLIMCDGGSVVFYAVLVVAMAVCLVFDWRTRKKIMADLLIAKQEGKA